MESGQCEILSTRRIGEKKKMKRRTGVLYRLRESDSLTLLACILQLHAPVFFIFYFFLHSLTGFSSLFIFIILLLPLSLHRVVSFALQQVHDVSRSRSWEIQMGCALLLISILNTYCNAFAAENCVKSRLFGIASFVRDSCPLFSVSLTFLTEPAHKHIEWDSPRQTGTFNPSHDNYSLLSTWESLGSLINSSVKSKREYFSPLDCLYYLFSSIYQFYV